MSLECFSSRFIFETKCVKIFIKINCLASVFSITKERKVTYPFLFKNKNMPTTYNVGCAEHYKGAKDMGWSCLSTSWKRGTPFVHEGKKVGIGQITMGKLPRGC